MNKSLAALLLLLGLMAVMLSGCYGEWDMKKLGTVKFETNTYEITRDFSNLSIKVDTAHVSLLPSEDGSCRVVCYEQKKVKHEVRAADGTLTVNVRDTRKWYNYIGVSFQTARICIYLPKAQYAALSVKGSTGDTSIPAGFTFESIDVSASTGNVSCFADCPGTLRIKLSTGDITLSGVSASEVSLSVSTGTTAVSDLRCASLSARGSTGGITLQGVHAQGTLFIKRSTGKVNLLACTAGELTVRTDTGKVALDGCDAGRISIETDTGDVKGTLLSEKIFITKTDTGKINVPKTVTGGICEITTDTGDIRIELCAP